MVLKVSILKASISVHILRASPFPEPRQYLTDKLFRWPGAAFPRYFAANGNGVCNDEPSHPPTCPSFQSTRCWSLLCFTLCIHCGWMELGRKGCPGVHIWWSVMRTGTWDIKSINMPWTMWHAVTLLMHFPTLWRSLLCSCAALIVFHFTIINSCARGGDLELSFIHILPYRGRPSRLEKGLH